MRLTYIKVPLKYATWIRLLCHAPYLARVRGQGEVKAAGDWPGKLSVRQAVQYLDLLLREELPSHLLPEEVPPTMTIGQRRVLDACGGRERQDVREK